VGVKLGLSLRRVFKNRVFRRICGPKRKEVAGWSRHHNGKGKGKGTGKVVPVLFLNWVPRHEGVLGEWRYSSTHSLASALAVGEWSASRPGRFIPGKEPLIPIG